MTLQGQACRLTIHLGEDDQWHHKPLYTEIVHRAHVFGLAGASVFRGRTDKRSLTIWRTKALSYLNLSLISTDQSSAGTGARVGSVDRFALPRATRVSRRLADRPAAGRQQLRHLRGGVIVCTVVFGAPAATLCRCCTGEAVAPSPMRCLRAAPVVILFAVFQRYFVASDLGSRVNG